jgi:endonuclease/exonuclease/phosphatase family metal-dependent hydrolase
MALTLATFNVKNLLEPQDDAARAILPAKLDWTARMLRACDADVVGLQEVGPPELLAGLVGRLEGYAAQVVGTADARGIRCALVSRLPLIDVRVHVADSITFPVYREGDPQPFGSRIPLRRGIVHARAQAPGLGPFDVLVAHLKSSRPMPLRDREGRELEPQTPRGRSEGVLRSLVWRAAEALHVRGIVDTLLEANSGSRVAVIGDLNDVPGSPVVAALQGRDEGMLLDCTANVAPASRFSAIHGGRRSQIDHALATASLYGHLRDARFLNTELREHVFLESRGGEEPPTIDSDHAPLVVRFE